MLCSQCGGTAERCEHCGAGVCDRRFCVELHEAACAVVTTLPSAPAAVRYLPRKLPRRRERNPEAERALAEHLGLTIDHHRQSGRAALLAGDLDTAFDELWAARQLEPDLDRLTAEARENLPQDWELETDLTPLARALAAHQHPRAADAWRRVLDDRPARSIQCEAAEFFAQHFSERHQPRRALRALHAASELGRATSPEKFHTLYRQAGLNARTAFTAYLAASRLDKGTARALGLHDPLTGAAWPDQDPCWWLREAPENPSADSDHQTEALARARDLATSQRELGWVMLAEGDQFADCHGVRALGRSVRAGRADPADEDAFVRIRLAYEGAAERLPEVAWAWYRLAELLAWAGFGQRAAEHLAQAERRGLGRHHADREALRALVAAGLGQPRQTGAVPARPFPSEPFQPSLWARLTNR
jgi:hypothetical protein